MKLIEIKKFLNYLLSAFLKFMKDNNSLTFKLRLFKESQPSQITKIYLTLQFLPWLIKTFGRKFTIQKHDRTF